MATTAERRSRWSLMARGGLALGLAALCVCLLAAIAVSPAPMRGAELFGALANKIKGNPGATTAVSFGALGVLWLGLALLVAAQEWLACRRRA